jgi:hypothetical protein
MMEYGKDEFILQKNTTKSNREKKEFIFRAA